MNAQVVDLTLPFYDGRRGVAYKPELNIADHGFNTTTLQIYSHALTHMDAPKHFLPDGEGIETIPLARCIGPAHVIDLTHVSPNSQITVDDMGDHTGKITEGSRLLLHTGWSTHAEATDYRTQFPRLSLALAQWFVACGVWLIGVEAPSVASLAKENRTELTEVHQTLLRAGVIIVEGLCNLDQLPPDVEFIALPLNMPDLDGSPVRAVARF
ncbi:MAG: cyclase family protein [Chloroflexota bacterium]